MNLPDIINGSFELGAGIAVLLHCLALHRDRQARGISLLAVAFFVAWGLWNLFYYPHLGQLVSFIGGLFVTAANFLYVGMLWRYRRIG